MVGLYVSRMGRGNAGHYIAEQQIMNGLCQIHQSEHLAVFPELFDFQILSKEIGSANCFE